MKLKKLPEKLIGLGVAALAFVVYLATLSHGACPGPSAKLVASHSGVIPLFSPDSPLWTWLVMLVKRGAGDNFVIALNFISAVCGALSVWMVYELVSEGITFFMDENLPRAGRQRIAALLAGVTAAVMLAFSIPFWVVSNRAHTATFDILLLLLAARLLLFYMDYGRLWIALLFSFVFGLGVVEFSTFIVVAPVFGVWLLYVMWKRDVLRLPVVLLLILCTVLGLLAYMPAAWSFYKSPGYELRQYTGFWDIIWEMWRSQYYTITHGLPREGWLIILFVSVVPWLAMLSVIRRSLNDERDWGIYFLHIIITAMMIAVLFNFKIAPVAIVGMGRILITPYVLMAMVYGYLVAYWFLLPSAWGANPDAFLTKFYRQGLGWILAVPLLGTAVVAAALNAPQASNNQTAFVQELSDEVVASLNGREWLVTNGAIDNNLLLAARRQGVTLRTINLRAGGNSVYLDYLASQFDDVRLQNLAKIGASTLLDELLRTRGEKDVAILSMPDIWVHTGFKPVPNRMVFLGVRDLSALDTAKLLQDNREFQKRFVPVLEKYADRLKDNGFYVWGRRHAGLVANDLGVLMDDLGQPSDAFALYRAARKLDPDNISALLNISAMVKSGQAKDVDGTIARAVKELDANVTKTDHIWSLSHYYGYVRTPEAFTSLGWKWAYTGAPGMAISAVERAEQMLPDGERNKLQAIKAALFMKDNRAAESSEIYREILKETPDDLEALGGMLNISMQQGEFDKAASYLQRAAAAGMPANDVALQKAAIVFAKGDLKKSREMLEELLVSERKLLRGWLLLSDIAFRLQDRRLLDKCLRSIERIEGDRGYYGSIIRAQRAVQARDFKAAMEYYETALDKNPANTELHEKLLRLEMVLGRPEKARLHVKSLLLANPDNALALYMRGSMQIGSGDFDLAEDSLRHSLVSARLPMTLNDLAWLLQRKGENEEAILLIDEALQQSPKKPALWDTKGEILLGMKRYKDAVDAFGQSLALFDKNHAVHLHMAEAHQALGHTEVVKDIVKRIERVQESLSSDDREVLSRLQLGISGRKSE